MSNPRKSRASSRGTNRGKDVVTDDSTSPGEQYALVLYDDKTKGVVESKHIIKKDRVVGGRCKAPNPCDSNLLTRQNAKDKMQKYDAFLVQFGRK